MKVNNVYWSPNFGTLQWIDTSIYAQHVALKVTIFTTVNKN